MTERELVNLQKLASTNLGAERSRAMPHICGKCNAHFSSKKELKSHKRKTHVY